MAKRSFDIGRKPAPSAVKPKRRRAKKAKPTKAKGTHPRLSTRAPKKKLRDRKREAFMRTATLSVLGAVIAAGALLYILWLPALRISTVEGAGAGDANGFATIAKRDLAGTYAGVFPRDSFFLYPERAIRADILDQYPEVSAVSMARTSFSELKITGLPRVAAFLWCGGPDSLAATDTSCYNADTEGLVFALADARASTTETDLLHVYAVLDSASSTASYPLKGRVLGSAKLPDILRFAHAIEHMNIPIASVAVRGDEADLFVAPSTRITYVIGHEKAAEESAHASFKTLSLTDGSLEYVDLRFDGKVYLKRKGE